MGYLKGKSNLMLYERFPKPEYIQNQLKEDELHNQLTLKEYIDSFTGSK